MERFHLNKTKVVSIFVGIICFLYFIYSIFYLYDLYNITNTLVINAELVKTDDSLSEITEYELTDNNLRMGCLLYKDVDLAFYGVSTDNDTVYFSDESNTLIQSINAKDTPLLERFWSSFIVGTKFIIVYVSLLLLFVLLTLFKRFNSFKVNILGIEVLLVIYTLMFIATFLILS